MTHLTPQTLAQLVRDELDGAGLSDRGINLRAAAGDLDSRDLRDAANALHIPVSVLIARIERRVA